MVIFSYLVVLGLTALVSQRPLFVILQVLSLASVTLFFIAYVEASANNQTIFQSNLLSIAIAFSLVCIGSLLFLQSRPELAYEITPEGNRFRGLLNEPAMMGAISGLLLGIAIFGKFYWIIRVLGSCAALPCLYLTGSRTSSVAVVIGLFVTGILYLREKKSWIVGLTFVCVVGGLGLIAADLRISVDTQSRIIRSGSLNTMSGRTVLWELALRRYLDSPVLGYGFTTGSDALLSDLDGQLSTAFGVSGFTQHQSFSLHSGYIQALLDSGAIGACLYVAILGTALWRLVRYDHERHYGAEMYCLVFFALSNIADTIIFGAAVFYEVFYWYLSVLALSGVGLALRISIQCSDGMLDHGSALISKKQDLSIGAYSQPTKSIDRHFPLLQD